MEGIPPLPVCERWMEVIAQWHGMTLRRTTGSVLPEPSVTDDWTGSQPIVVAS
jgi:hypothetical protein